MIRDKEREKSEDGSTQNNEGLKRRDLPLSGTSLMAASKLTGAGFATPAQASGFDRARAHSTIE
jgi:hypothetical protein